MGRNQSLNSMLIVHNLATQESFEQQFSDEYRRLVRDSPSARTVAQGIRELVS